MMAPNGVPVSPNVGYLRAKFYEKSRIAASIRMQEDTMWVTYTNEANDQVLKIERYVYFAAYEDVNLDGEQVYLRNGIPYCSEIIANGLLKRTIWYDEKGQKERIYMFKNSKDITELQFYPSGKVSLRTDHFGTPQAVQAAYNEDGSDGEWTSAALIGEPEEFDAYFNRTFRYNMLYTNEVFKLYVTVDSLGAFSAWVFGENGAFLTRLDGPNAPLWTPATINGRPVQSSVYRFVTYNPMEYISSSDTLPMHSMQSQYVTYNGIRWIDSKIYSFVTADTCSQMGTLVEKGDTTILFCFDKLSGDKIARQCYVENDFGKKIKEGRFTYYKHNKKFYEEWYVNDTVNQVVHYYENEVPQMRMIRLKNRKGAAWDTIRCYYPNGSLKMLSVPAEKDKEDDFVAYYDKQGNPTTEVVMPSYPGKEKALNKYLRKNVRIVGSKLWEKKNWNALECWADFFVEVDEKGNVLHVGKGASSCTQNYKGTPLSRMEIEQLYDLLKECLESNPTLWEPGSIQGEPTSMYTKIHVKYSYSR